MILWVQGGSIGYRPKNGQQKQTIEYAGNEDENKMKWSEKGYSVERTCKAYQQKTAQEEEEHEKTGAAPTRFWSSCPKPGRSSEKNM